MLVNSVDYSWMVSLQESDLEDARGVGGGQLDELPVSVCGCRCLLPKEVCCPSSCRSTHIHKTG